MRKFRVTITREYEFEAPSKRLAEQTMTQIVGESATANFDVSSTIGACELEEVEDDATERDDDPTPFDHEDVDDSRIPGFAGSRQDYTDIRDAGRGHLLK